MFVNVSASELPGAFVCTVPADLYVLAGSFIHEFHHNTLFGIEERGPFFDMSEEDVVEGENHYSPWVETLRPLHGILHAVYVFLPVFRYWSAALRDGSLGRVATRIRARADGAHPDAASDGDQSVAPSCQADTAGSRNSRGFDGGDGRSSGRIARDWD